MESEVKSDEAKINSWLEGVDDPAISTDFLNRNGFVQSLALALLDLPRDKSMVTAVFGPWGSGKSWIMENLARELKSDDLNLSRVCKFAPWEMRSQDQILAEFFTTIANQLPKGEEHKELTNSWQELEAYTLIGSIGFSGVAGAMALGGAGDISALPMAASTVLGSISKLFGKAKESNISNSTRKSLSSVKEELSSKLIKYLDSPIIVLLDDLDRLTDEEIQMIVRLINTTANLPKIHYVIFGDRKQIASALNPICGADGDRYLEKIIHNSFQVSEPSKNQILMRLSDGIQSIAKTSGVEFSPNEKRFRSFWDTFLSKRVLNLRDAHRLLRTLSFHASALSRKGLLEVDLLDLLGVDFLRLFDPITYKMLAEAPIDRFIYFGWRSSLNDKEDNAWLINLIESSSLSVDVAIGVISSLFPKSLSGIKNYLERKQLRMISYHHYTGKLSPLCISCVDKANIYFQLDLNAGDLPEIEFKHFIDSSGDVTALSEIINDLQRNNWLTQLFYRIQSSSVSELKQLNLVNVLKAASLFSDSFGNGSGGVESEINSFFRLTDTLIGRIEEDKLPEILRFIVKNEYGVSSSLYLLENLRASSGCTLHDDPIEPPHNMPIFEQSEIEALSDDCFQFVKKRYIMNGFMKESNEAIRAYRLVNAFGVDRTELILKEELVTMSESKTWKLIEAIGISLSPAIRFYWLSEKREECKAGESLLTQLYRFASYEFWLEFIDSFAPPTELSHNLVYHLRYALKNHISYTTEK